MGFFDDVGNFFSKEIPKFFTKTIPSAFEKETYAPDLVPLRKRVADLKTSVANKREQFYAEQAALTAANARYVQLSDDFETTGGTVAEFDLEKTDRLTRELDGTEKTLRDIAQVSRTVTNVVTLGLAELAYVHADIEEERRTLSRQVIILTGTSKRFDNAIAQVVSAREAVEAQITWVEEQMASAGIEAGPSAASELTAAEAEQTARREMAARLLGLGTDMETITGLTGLTEAEVNAVEPHAPEPEAGDADALLTDEEKQVLAEEGQG